MSRLFDREGVMDGGDGGGVGSVGGAGELRRSLPHPNPPLRKGRGQESHIKLNVVNDNLAPPLSKGRLGGVWIYASSLNRVVCTG